MSNDILTDVTGPKRRLPIIPIIAVVIAVIALIVSLTRNRPTSDVEKKATTLQKVMASGTLRVGYEGYPPYTIKDPGTGKLTGISVDITEYIAREAGWKIEWVQTSPDTKIPDLQAGRFDVMTEPCFRTIPRATRVLFSRPYAYFGDAVGIVRKNEKRFKTIDDVNKAGVIIVVRQGYSDQTFAADNLPLATLRALKVADASQVFLEVTAGRADIALADLEQVKAYVAEHPNDVEIRFSNPPPCTIPAGFMLKQDDIEFCNFLNATIDYMEANGVFTRINRKYGVTPISPTTGP